VKAEPGKSMFSVTNCVLCWGLAKKSYTQMHTGAQKKKGFIFIPLQKRHIMDTNSLANVCDESV
jgi:hypothetical protein